MVEKLMEEIILQTAYRLFTSQGIQLFTMDDIATRLAISKKTLYRFFQSRQDLVQKVCLQVADSFNEAMQETDNAEADNLQRILGYMKANVLLCKRIAPVFFSDLQKHYPAESAYLTTALANMMQPRVLKVLEQGIIEGVFRGSLHPRLIVSLLHQHIQRDFEFAAELVNDYSKDEVFRQASFLFLYGIIAPAAIPQLENELKKYGLPAIEQPKETDLYK